MKNVERVQCAIDQWIVREGKGHFTIRRDDGSVVLDFSTGGELNIDTCESYFSSSSSHVIECGNWVDGMWCDGESVLIPFCSLKAVIRERLKDGEYGIKTVSNDSTEVCIDGVSVLLRYRSDKTITADIKSTSVFLDSGVAKDLFKQLEKRDGISPSAKIFFSGRKGDEG